MGRLNGDFKEQARHNDFVERLYDVLIAIREQEHDDPEVLQSLLQAALDNMDTTQNSREVQELMLYMRTVSGGKGFSDIKALFEIQVDRLGAMTDTCRAHLDAAFDFMETAFGESQEMVIFITELNTSSPATDFIRQNGCDRYYKYNEGLLFTTGRDRMLQEIGSVAPYMDFLGI